MLDESQKDRLRELFATGAELATAERAAFVQRQCAGDPELQRELAELLQVQAARLGDFLAGPAVALPDGWVTTMGATPDPVIVAPPLPEIHGYADLERVAEGGMGTVYRAQQVYPVQRTVAIKIIRSGTDSDTVLARFAAERQALALMNHPYVAAVFDAGTDTMGRPFIAMEFADGLPITEFCESKRLTLDERLELFVKTCQAVDHAHRRGVLHRDLKPSNVLVCQSGDEVIPKVIDFGIAKAIEGSLGEHSIHTLEGTLLGTPEYMSPEQLSGGESAVDTRSDVFSLGVMLYELVVGERPIESSRFRDADLKRFIQIVRDEVPSRPSTRLRELRSTAVDDAAPRPDWVRRLQGDLDWIVMTALEKEPERRYGSPHELAADVSAFLEHRPVAAGPPSGLYLLRRFTRRYRVQVAAAGMVLLSLVVGLIGTLWFLMESKANEAFADRRAAEAVAARRDADGIRIATEAAMLARESPNLALLLALEAAELTDNHAVNQTIHRVLPHHSEVAVLDSYDHGAREVLFLDDGQLLIRGCDASVQLWDRDLRTLVRRYVGHTDEVYDMALDAAQRRLLTVSLDGRARVWDVATGECTACTEDHAATVAAGVFSPDGSRFATVTIDGTARVFDTQSAASRLRLVPKAIGRGGIVFDPSGRRLATATCDGFTRVWNVETGALELELPGRLPNSGRMTNATVRLSAAGDHLVTEFTQRGGIETLVVHTTAGERVLHLDDSGFVGFLDNDRLLFSRGGTWGIASLPLGQILERHELAGISKMIEATADGRIAVAVDVRLDLCLVDLQSNAVFRSLRGQSDKTLNYLDVAFHPDGDRFAVTGRAVRVWTLRPEFVPIDLPSGHPFGRSQLVAVGSEALLLVPAMDGKPAAWTLWSVERGEILTTIALPGLRSLELSPCGRRLIGIERDSGLPGDDSAARIAVFDCNGQRLRTIALPPEFRHHTVRADGRAVVTTHGTSEADARISFHDLDTGGHLATRSCETLRISGWASGPDFDRLAVHRNSRLCTDVFDARTGELLARATGPARGWHLDAAISPDGRYLLVAQGDLRAVVWDLEPALRGGDVAPIAEYARLVRGNTMHCGFAANGSLSWVLCGNEVHLFETMTGRPFSVLRLDARCGSAAVNADGTELLTVTHDGRCQRWPLDPIAVAQRLAVGQLEGRDLVQYGIGTPSERAAREAAMLARIPTPRRLAHLGELALADGDLDAAIDWYQRAFELRPRKWEVDIYLQLIELCCRRLHRDGDGSERREADCATAFAAIERALHYGASFDRVRSLRSIDVLIASPRFAQLTPR